MTIMSNQIYNVQTIPPDLRREETILQIADSLDYLDKVANDIFKRITAKVGDNTSRLQKVNDRVRLAEAKVNKLTGSNKATKVHASAKYPIAETLEEYTSTFGKGANLREPKHPHYRLQSKHQNVDDRVFRDKLQYYNVHLNVKKRARDGNNIEEGLGGLPKGLPSVSSLLLFNTSENPYKKYVMLDPLGVVTKTRSTLEHDEAGLADAPSTIAQSEEMLQLKTESYSYMPDIGEVPEIAVPDFLPNLLGVADDLSFGVDLLSSSIAPSVRATSNMPELPSILPEPDAIPSGPAELPGVVLDVSGGPPPPGPPPPGPPPPPPPSGPPPPPPPPPAEAPPPPPPGPPPSIQIQDAPPEVSAPSDGRASLLDSIRNAGGLKKLKSGKDRKIASKKKKKEETESGASSASAGGGGDLMSDLFSKLTMRRKGISGTGKPEKSESSVTSGGGSAMDKISSMIPAPPKPSEDASAGGDDDDWD